MARGGRVLSSAPVEIDGDHVVEVKVDLGGGVDIRTPEQFLPPGVDARPLPDDNANVEDGAGAGVKVVTGYQDNANEPKAGPGEHRTYARAQDGSLACELWQKTDGSIHMKVYTSQTIHLESTGPIIIESPDVRLGAAPGRRVACEGDIVIGAINALSSAPGNPIVPAAGAPTPSGGVTFVAQIVSGRPSVKA